METTTIQYDITPPKGLVRLNLPELWRYRELLYIFVWRDVKVRYKQTMLGIVWAIFQPFLTMIIFTIFFGHFAKLPSDNVPYPIFVYAGLLFWNYYSTALTTAANCLVENENIVKKVYFPRLILPLSTTATPLIDFLAASVVLLALGLYFHFFPHLLGLIAIPLLLFIAFLAAAGLGLLLSAINARYRDVRYILPFFIQLLLFLTPVIYPVSLVPAPYQWILYLNPMTGVVNVARSLFFGTSSIDWPLFGISVAASIVMFIIGLIYFRKTERFFADIL